MAHRFALAMLFGFASLTLSRAFGDQPQWIWPKALDRFGENNCSTFQSIVLEQPMESGRLRVVADFAHLTVAINERVVMEVEPYDPPREIDIARYLQPGTNRLALIAQGIEGPSAVACCMTVSTRDGEVQTFKTNSQWSLADGGAIGTFGHVDPDRWSLPRLPDVNAFAEYNQWKEALGGPAEEKLSPLPRGFEITRVRDAKEGEDSWVSLTLDPQGRIIIGQEKQGLLRLTLSDDRSTVVHTERINDSLRECRGLIWHEDALYAHANYSKALYRLRDSNGDDTLDEITELIATSTGTGHGRNDLVVGPGGMLHTIVGDDINVPDQAIRHARPEPDGSRELGHWAKLVVGSHSTTWEAMNRGLRNPYGIDFNPDGEGFTYDADNEGDVGLPFYRPTRINHLVSGANYGWHQTLGNTRSLPVDAPDSWPTTFDVGRGSPTSVRFGTHSQFSQRYRDALFALDWAYGRILAIQLVPVGASYHASGEVFLEGRPLNVTDLEFDSRGAMWFVTGGRKTHSSLYRVRYVGEEPRLTTIGEEPRPTTTRCEQWHARQEFSAVARDQRRSLEVFHVPGRAGNLNAIDDIWPNLGSPDPWIRGAARVALEWQPVESWRDRVFSGEVNFAHLTAMLALARAGNNEDRKRLSQVVATLKVPAPTRTEKLTLLRICEISGVPEDPHLRDRLGKTFLSFATEMSESVNREVAKQLTALQLPEAISFSFSRIASVTDQLDHLHYIEVLSHADVGWTKPLQQKFFDLLAHAKYASFGDRFMPPFFEQVERAALANVRDEGARAKFAQQLAEPSSAETSKPLTSKPVTRPTVREWSVAELLAPEKNPTGPNIERGRELFAEAQCASCHVCGVVGRPYGPDLSTVARRFTRENLIESIIHPSSVIAEAYRNVQVLTTDGTVVTGRIIQDDFRESKLILATDPASPYRRETLSKSDVESWSESAVSPMPDGLLNTLQRDEIEDLLAFLMAE